MRNRTTEEQRATGTNTKTHYRKNSSRKQNTRAARSEVCVREQVSAGV